LVCGSEWSRVVLWVFCRLCQVDAHSLWVLCLVIFVLKQIFEIAAS